MEQECTIKHILMCEDDKDQVILFRAFLKKEYPQVSLSVIHSGEELVPFLHLYPVDVLFLDLHLPCKNGFECLEEIKNDPITKDIPVIVYSSSAHLNDIQNAFIHHADFYLVKPFLTDHLRTALKTILSVDWKQNPSIRYHYFINNRFVPFTSAA